MAVALMSPAAREVGKGDAGEPRIAAPKRHRIRRVSWRVWTVALREHEALGVRPLVVPQLTAALAGHRGPLTRSKAVSEWMLA